MLHGIEGAEVSWLCMALMVHCLLQFHSYHISYGMNQVYLLWMHLQYP